MLLYQYIYRHSGRVTLPTRPVRLRHEGGWAPIEVIILRTPSLNHFPFSQRVFIIDLFVIIDLFALGARGSVLVWLNRGRGSLPVCHIRQPPFVLLILGKYRPAVKSLERWPRRANLGRPVHAVNPVEKLVDNDLRTRLWVQDLLKVPPRCFYELLLLSANLDPVEYSRLGSGTYKKSLETLHAFRRHSIPS